MGVSDIWGGREGKQRKFYFGPVNSNMSSDQAESSMSGYHVTTLYIRALDTRNIRLVFICQCPICQRPIICKTLSSKVLVCHSDVERDCTRLPFPVCTFTVFL